MHRRVRPVPVPPRPAEELPVVHPLAGLSNQALAQLARAPKPDPQRTKVKPIKALDKTDEWAETIKQRKSVMPLYADLATQLGATVIRDVKGTGANDITGALTPDRVQPGLNFVSRGLSKGRCWYIEDGKPVNTLTVTAKGPLPKVALGVGPAVFIPGNKAFALATLRHEIEHAAHRQMALDWLQKWRDAGAKGDFRAWLGSQQIALADRQLIGELVDGGTVNTEVLAHLEGFITAFPLEDHATANPQRAVYDQLLGVAEHWKGATAEIRQEAVKRITEMAAAQQGTALEALKAAFTRLKGEPDAPQELVKAVLSARG